MSAKNKEFIEEKDKYNYNLMTKEKDPKLKEKLMKKKKLVVNKESVLKQQVKLEKQLIPELSKQVGFSFIKKIIRNI